MAGAPVDFGGRVFPNPDNIQPVLDTDIKPDMVNPWRDNAYENAPPRKPERQHRQSAARAS